MKQHLDITDYLRGEKAGKVVIITNAKIDDIPIVFFANELTWTFVGNLKNIRCERTRPTFNCGVHKIDRSQATWYNDNSPVPQYYEW